MADNDDIPFNRDFPLKPGVVDEPRPGVRRVLCNNPSPFTFTGTVSYIVGRGNVAIIDPDTGKPTRVRYEIKDGKKVRVAKSGKVIPEPDVFGKKEPKKDKEEKE